LAAEEDVLNPEEKGFLALDEPVVELPTSEVPPDFVLFLSEPNLADLNKDKPLPLLK
jgi:hypothetical protein